MTDLVKRLRDLAPLLSADCGFSVEERSLPDEAADEIERLKRASSGQESGHLLDKVKYAIGQHGGYGDLTASAESAIEAVLDDMREWTKGKPTSFYKGKGPLDVFDAYKYEATFGTPPPPSLKGY